jgi:hypothetical protein
LTVFTEAFIAFITALQSGGAALLDSFGPLVYDWHVYWSLNAEEETHVKRNFETFTHRSTPVSSKTPRVGLQKRGTMSLNAAAYKALGEPEAILLMYDKQSKAVGLQAVAADAKYAYPVRKQPNSQSYMLGAVSFCNYYEIDTSQTRAFTPEIEEGILVFELSKGTILLPRLRTKKQTQTKKGKK